MRYIRTELKELRMLCMAAAWEELLGQVQLAGTDSSRWLATSRDADRAEKERTRKNEEPF